MHNRVFCKIMQTHWMRTYVDGRNQS